MRCAPVIVLLASSTVSQGIQQLEDVADGRQVVVVREHDGEFYYYVFMVGAVRLRLVAAISPDLASALHLDELPPAATGQLSGAPPSVGGVVLEGREVVGVIVGDPDTDAADDAESAEDTPHPTTHDRMAPAPPTEGPPIQAARPPSTDPDSREFSRPRRWPRVRGIWPHPTPGAVRGPTQPRDDRTELSNEQPESPELPEPRRVRADVFVDGDSAPRNAFVRGQ
ncbi:MAG: Ternary complex associated domain 7, partial [Mycobacterium sp.]|nr:Ternary complex associated domain 7 [Mycobacterium sp.]